MMRTWIWITVIAICTLVCSISGLAQPVATVMLPNTTAVHGDMIAVPINVSVESSVGLAQFVVEYDATIIQFHETDIGQDIPGFVVSLTNMDLPFSPTADGTNENVLVQLSGGGTETFSGEGIEVAKLHFAAIDSEGTSPLAFDQVVNHTFLTTVSLQDITGDDIEFITGSVEIVSTTHVLIEREANPHTYSLRQNYPNPFNTYTVITYHIPEAVVSIHTTLTIYNMLGQEVHTLVDETQGSGYYTMAWNARDYLGNGVASGLYFFRLKSGDFTASRTMLLIK